MSDLGVDHTENFLKLIDRWTTDLAGMYMKETGERVDTRMALNMLDKFCGEWVVQRLDLDPEYLDKIRKTIRPNDGA